MWYLHVVMDTPTQPWERCTHSLCSNSWLGGCSCFYYLIANLYARNDQSLMIVDFLSIDRRHLFRAVTTISSFPFAIAMVLYERFALLKLLNAIWRGRPSWRIRSKSDYNKSMGAYLAETSSIAMLFYRPIIMFGLIEERLNFAGHRILVITSLVIPI